MRFRISPGFNFLRSLLNNLKDILTHFSIYRQKTLLSLWHNWRRLNDFVPKTFWKHRRQKIHIYCATEALFWAAETYTGLYELLLPWYTCCCAYRCKRIAHLLHCSERNDQVLQLRFSHCLLYHDRRKDEDRRHEHIRPVLASLHWLPVSFKIDFKIILITIKHFMVQPPATLLNYYSPMSQGAASDPQAQLSWLFLSICSGLKVAGLLQSGPLSSGTPCLRIWDLQYQ